MKWWQAVLAAVGGTALVTWATRSPASAPAYLDLGSPPPPPPPYWTTADMALLAAEAKRLQANPADLLLVLWSESGGNPHAVYVDKKTGVEYTRMLNQVLRAFAKNADLTDAEWVDSKNWSVARQLPHVAASLRSTAWAQSGRPFPHAGAIYAVNFAPSRVQTRGVAPDVVLYDRSDGDAYTRNAAFDFGKDGRITVGDLIERLRMVAQKPSYKGALALLRTATGDAKLSPGLPG